MTVFDGDAETENSRLQRELDEGVVFNPLPDGADEPVLGVLTGQYPSRTMPVAMMSTDATNETETEPDSV